MIAIKKLFGFFLLYNYVAAIKGKFLLCVKNWEGSKFLPYLQGYKLAFHTFVDADRRHKVPGSETIDILTNDTT